MGILWASLGYVTEDVVASAENVIWDVVGNSFGLAHVCVSFGFFPCRW